MMEEGNDHVLRHDSSLYINRGWCENPFFWGEGGLLCYIHENMCEVWKKKRNLNRIICLIISLLDKVDKIK